MTGVYLLFLLLFVYCLLLLAMAWGYYRTQAFSPGPAVTAEPVSLIVCARNEEAYIGRCLNGILAQHYNKHLLQLIFVNDASSDSTLNIAKSILDHSGLDHLILNNPSKIGKKASLTKAIEKAKHPLVITRDADTFTLSDQWLNSMVQFRASGQYDLVIGPISIAHNSGLLWALQCIENNVLTVITGGSAYFKHAFLCSGANLMFTKTVFEKVNGYHNHRHIASGDDVLFLEDVKKTNNTGIGFLKGRKALVYTYPQFKLFALFLQKVRWAQKFKHNSNPFNFTLSFLTFTVNAIWLVAFIGLFLQVPLHNYLLVLVVLKLLTELFLLFLSRRFMRNNHLIWYAFAVALLYPFYTLAVALASLFLQPKWK